jgi:transcriptional regulator with XRE-family HTH domain
MPAVPDLSLGPRLRQLREGLGLSLRDVANDTGISSGHLSLIENGRVRAPSPSVLQRLADRYGADAQDLLVLAGYIKLEAEQVRRSHARVAMATMSDLTPEEIDEVESFISYLRQRKHAKARATEKRRHPASSI